MPPSPWCICNSVWPGIAGLFTPFSFVTALVEVTLMTMFLRGAVLTAALSLFQGGV